MSIYLGEGKTIVLSDMQGPAPDGFHVPLYSEWQAIYNACKGLGLGYGSDFATYLKMPMSGNRYYSTSIGNVGSSGFYWSSTPYDTNRAYGLSFSGSYIDYQSNYPRSQGFSVRGFKNTPVVPTSSWTVLYQGTGNAGVYHNSTDGLISMSSDGTTWYTIMDKNLGATTVYNYGDTLTDANCGNVFQRGNNYAFPGTNSSDGITTSSTQVNVTGYGPGNYYNSSTWITARPRQNSSNNGNNLRGGVSQGSSTVTKTGIKEVRLGEGKECNDMQGPCPDGFHVPTKDELTSVNNILKLWNTYSWNLWRICLHMPYAGSMSATSGGSVGGGSTAYYWSSTWSGDRPVSLYMQSNNLTIQADYYTTDGMSIRPFKDEPVAADSNWTLEFQGTWGGGIYHNSTLGLISISWDGSAWTTIADKNLGATVVYNDGDTLSAENCGKYYQRGNNYGFPKSGATTTSTTLVNANSYGPGNYYNSDTFIKSGVSNWDSSNNANLRGGVSQGTTTKPGIKAVYVGGPREVIVSDMQGPCPDGFHIPTVDDWQGLNTIMTGLSITTGNGWRTCFHMPFAGERGYSNASISSQNSMGMYWSSSNYVGANDYARRLTLYSSFLYYDDSTYRAEGHPIRGFKDTPVVPDSNWTVIYQSGNAGIYHNPKEGIISASSDGETWITIADKNLGATVVYNDGDTLSEANCGGYYQWGNNYMFPFSGSVTTSSTKVNAGSYGPGNYYSSSTFITGNYNWDSSKNNNLRGGVSQGTSTKTVYNKIRSKE